MIKRTGISRNIIKRRISIISGLPFHLEFSMSNGVLTAQIALSLQQEFEKHGYEVLHDHRLQITGSSDKLGKLRIWIGDSPKRIILLSDLDIAIINPNDNKVVALIEIEETTNKPKVILGDILAFLLGNGISFRGKYDFKIGKWTTLIVIGHDERQSHDMRNAYLNEQMNSIKSKLDTDTPNASIGRIVVDSYSDEKQLEEKLNDHVFEVIEFFRIL